MCGIVGIMEFAGAAAIDPALVERMRDTLTHRGPDDQGVYVNHAGSVALGHRRLSILDPSPAGHQPMGFDGLWAVHNGEIYNFKDIRVELMGAGHEFSTHSDTEVILKGYRQWGPAVVDRFRGMYVTALWDEREQRLVLMRDRAGVKPLYYYRDGERFVFASELRALLEHPRVPREIDYDALSLYLMLGYVPTPLSIFKGIHKLEQGHVLTVHANGDLSKNKYWDVFDHYTAAPPPDSRPLAELTDELEHILIDSFRLRMVSDVPVGVFLSGGVDSSTVAALLQKHSSDPIKTFTIGFDVERFNEAEAAKQVARHLGTDHHELYLSTHEAMDIIGRIADIYDEPFGDASAIPTYLVSRLAREHVKVALSADGGDELFAGYQHHRNLLRAHQLITRLGPTARPLVVLAGMPPFKQILDHRVEAVDLKLRKLRFLARNEWNRSHFFFTGRSLWLHEEAERLLGRSGDGFDRFFDSFAPLEEVDGFVNWMRAADFRSYLPDDILVKVDRASMAVGLEGREPFLDHRIVEFAARLPMASLWNNGSSKHILREVLHRYVPKELVERPKTGFAAPLDEWFRGELKPLLTDHLGDCAIKAQGVFDPKMVAKELDDFYAGRIDSSSRLWLLLEFQLWWERWVG